MRDRVAFTLAAALAIAACSSPNGFPDRPAGDATTMDGDTGGSCAPGRWQCGSPTEAHECRSDGTLGPTIDCASMGQVCAAGLGCATCGPGTVRCSPDSPDTTQACNADGTAWTDGSTCDVAGGEHCVSGRCTRPCSDLSNSYLGCDYWPTTTANGSLATAFTYAVVLSNTQTYPVTVTVEGGALTSTMSRVVQPGAVDVLQLPWVYPLSENTGMCCSGVFAVPGVPACAARSGRVSNGAYHLHTDGPIAAYQFNPLQYAEGGQLSYTADASLLLPQNVLGRHYLVFAYANEGPPFAAMDDRCTTTSIRGGYVAIVGAHASGTNNVLVRTTSAIFDPANPSQTLPAGEHMFPLAPGEVLQLVSQGYNADLTGTYVEGSDVLAVYSGHECAAIPIERPACDHLEEQLFPITAWGTSYAVSPLRYRGAAAEAAVIRVMAQRDGVILTFDGIAAPSSCSGVLARGQFCEFETDQAFRVTGSAAIAVAQYMHGLGDVPECQCAGTVCPTGPQCVGDPALVLEPPVDQFRTSYRFLVPDTYVDNFVNVVSSADAAIDLDGVRLTQSPIPTGSEHVTRIIHVEPGAHEIHSVDMSSRFGIKVYGVAPYTSYAYPGGLDLAAIAPP